MSMVRASPSACVPERRPPRLSDRRRPTELRELATCISPITEGADEGENGSGCDWHVWGPMCRGKRQGQRSRDERHEGHHHHCLLYTSDAADERSSVDLGG